MEPLIKGGHLPIYRKIFLSACSAHPIMGFKKHVAYRISITSERERERCLSSQYDLLGFRGEFCLFKIAAFKEIIKWV